MASRTVKLPSALEDPSAGEPYPGMYDDAQVIRDAIAAINGPTVLVAHSYAGVPVTEAVRRDSGVVHVVFVAAYMLNVGESMFGTHGVPMPESLDGLRPARTRISIFPSPSTTATRTTARPRRQSPVSFHRACVPTSRR